MGAIFSAIGRGINAIISAIAGVLMAIVGAITTVRCFPLLLHLSSPTVNHLYTGNRNNLRRHRRHTLLPVFRIPRLWREARAEKGRCGRRWGGYVLSEEMSASWIFFSHVHT
ncbi:hypothetical protein FB45DRAFT_935660 [Roridomyces roridus]|uniref:Uncharacterized protein n=1 Tax=Roridomyces roridus TaxID=1738132 RepID=A0AAD7BAJ6_9AGAR|nr:hypothetical protein FB45DRAFT_935660 [Roridomyces roridus]